MTSDHKAGVLEAAAKLRGKKKLVIGAGVLVVVILLAFGPLSTFDETDKNLLTHPVNTGDLIVDVVESGSIEATTSTVIRSRVEGQTTILSIIPEGTVITEQDVEEGLVLVELDSSALREQEVQQEIAVATELAKYTEARETYEIQKNQNESNLKAGELNIKFARMDMEKYLGKKAATLFIEGNVALQALLTSEYLGGEALQTKRELENNIALAQEEVTRATIKLDWTRRLLDKGYVTRDDLQADELALKRRTVEYEQAETALELFEKYEFQKQAEKLRSDYEEAVKELERIIAKNRAEISKAEAALKSAEATYENQVDQLAKIRKQTANCIIRAPAPGLVVYAGMGNPWQSDKIEEGQQVRERQEIIEIPDTSSMMVTAKIHEAVIARVNTGQRARITIDSLPGRQFEGEVTKVAVLPDPQHRWLNPNLKVYSTDISIFGNHPDLKPGMSAQVRIIINELDDVLMIPLQSVMTEGSETFCYVMSRFGPEKRNIETGEYNDTFIEVRSGLKEGEKVVLNMPAFGARKSAPEPTTAAGTDKREQTDERSTVLSPTRNAPDANDRSN
jgi:HlyD family secretion protein